MLFDIKKEYMDGEISKNEFMLKMFNIHKNLFGYSAFIKNSPIKKIEITHNQVIFTIFNGHVDIKICCDERDAHSLPMSYLNFSVYEEEEANMITKLIKPGDVVFDIGANIGWYTLCILLNHKETTVYSFEPIKKTYQYLINNLKLNKFGTDKAFNIGFSDENTTAKFFYDIECSPASSMANLREAEDTVIVECQVKKLDDFVSSIPSLEELDFIKCDVEGAEFYVFKGAQETIKKYKPIIFSEMLRKWARKFGYHPNDIINLFCSIDYDCYVIKNDKIEQLWRVDENTIQTNYLFFHKKKHADMINRFSVTPLRQW